MTADRPDLDGLREKAEQLRPAGDSSVDHLPASEWYIADVRFLHNSLLALIARAEKAEGAVAWVRDLHRPIEGEYEPFCTCCGGLYPCLTVSAALGADS